MLDEPSSALDPGQILAGCSPLLAVRYQIVLMFMLAGSAVP